MPGRLSFALAAAALLLGGAAVTPAPACAQNDSSSGEETERPNILVLIADDLGWRDTGAYGSDVARTPHIDRLAERGLKVQRAFLTTSSCSPSRISMISGRYPHEADAEDLHMPIADSVRTLPSFLSERAGYFTGLIGKAHGPPRDQFDWWDDQWRSTGVEDLRAFLDEKPEGAPFLMWTGFLQPHRPFGDLTTDAPTIEEPTDPDAVPVPPYLADRPDTRRDLADYHDAVAAMDVQIGNYLDELEKRGLRENTLVVFVSDNGAPFPRAKGSVYDAGVRTPLIVQGPGVDEGVTYDGLTSTVDLAPTLLEAAGVRVPRQAMTGESIAEMFTDQTAEGRERVYSMRNWHNTDAHIRSVRTDEWRLVTNGYPERRYPMLGANPSWYDLDSLHEAGALTKEQHRIFERPRAAAELYDVSADPYQTRSVAGEPAHAERTERLAERLWKWRKATGDAPAHLRRRPDNLDRKTGRFIRPDVPPFIEYTLRPD